MSNPFSVYQFSNEMLLGADASVQTPIMNASAAMIEVLGSAPVENDIDVQVRQHSVRVLGIGPVVNDTENSQVYLEVLGYKQAPDTIRTNQVYIESVGYSTDPIMYISQAYIESVGYSRPPDTMRVVDSYLECVGVGIEAQVASVSSYQLETVGRSEFAGPRDTVVLSTYIETLGSETVPEDKEEDLIFHITVN